jgi:DNA-binding FrmR family transcriptional regulator
VTDKKDKEIKHEHGHTHEHKHAHVHEHVLEDGTVVKHSHAHSEGGHKHKHAHSHEHTKAVLNRLARASGHLDKVRRMVEDGEDCSEVLIQLAAVRSALNNTGKIILKDHIDHCIVDAVETGDKETLDALNDAIDKFMK